MTTEKITMQSVEEQTFSEGNPKTAREIADEFLKYASLADIADQLADYWTICHSNQKTIDNLITERREVSGRFDSLRENTTKLLIESYDSGITNSEIRDFAQINALELQVKVRVTFRVDVDYTILRDITDIPNDDEIEESDFDIEISYNNNDGIEDEGWEINGFNAEVQ